MKEHPILFSSEMIRAILAGTKTQTRRVSKLANQIAANHEHIRTYHCRDGKFTMSRDAMHTPTLREPFILACPYGAPGDHLYVRESWQARDESSYYTRADVKLHHTTNPQCRAIWERHQPPAAWPEWIPSIHMPRWASRITLEITDVRVQRVQEISDGDARAEGMESCTPYDQFRALWELINGKRGYGWQSNPWVWCVSFRRIA